MINLSKERLLTSTIVAGLAAVGAMTFAPAVALAQDTASSTGQDDEQVTEVDDVIVVGSRIRRDVYSSPSPIQIITRDEATLAGLASTTEILQGTAISGGNQQINNLFGGFVVDGGPGVNTVSLRGLGATRTLLLLNGRRLAPSGSRGSVGSGDLNVLPSALVERVEVLRDGASSIYGSDAVAGVINIVTRDDLEGIELEAGYSATTDANGEGDIAKLSIAGGLQGDRWSLIGSVERYSREAVTLGARDFARCPTQGFTDGSDFIDPLTGKSKCFTLENGGVTVNTLGTPAFGGVAAPGATGTVFNRWRANSAVTTGLVGFEGVGGGNARDTFDPRMLEADLYSPVDLTTAYGAFKYDVGALGDAEIYTEHLFSRRESSQTDFRQLTLDYAVGSLLLPAQVAAIPGTAGAANEITNGLPFKARAFTGFQYGNEQTVDFAKNLIGIRGNTAFRDWTYDFYVSYSASDAEYTSEQFITDRLANSLNVVAAPAGTPDYLVRNGLTCAVNVADPNANCIPAAPLTSQTLAGVHPQDWLNYFVRPTTGTTHYNELVFSGGFAGSLFTLPAGEVQAFVGVELREMEIDDTPSIESQTGNQYGFTSSLPTRGTDRTKEVFGEIEVPLLANMPLADELTLNASARWTDYDSYGDDTTYKVGVLYSPTSWLSFRSSYGTSYRAPALYEQFLGATSGFAAQSTDVCSERDEDTNPSIFANCAAEGLPDDFEQRNSVTVLQAGGAAAGLTAETSSTFTGGVIVQLPLPSTWGDLSFAADYYDIEIENGVSQVGAAYILDQCYSQSAADFAADTGYCAFVSRDANDSLEVVNGYVNIASDQLSGIDYNVRYRGDIGPGTLLANLAVTQYLERKSVLFPDDPVYDTVGTVNSPEFVATASVNYGVDRWRVYYGVEWIQGSDDREYLLESEGLDYTEYGYDVSVDDYWLHTASVQYSLDEFSVTLGVRNLLNEDPPTMTGAYAGGIGNSPLYSGYDFIGRTVFLNLSKSF